MQAVVAVGRGKGTGISRRWLEQFRKKLTVVFIRVVSVRWWSWSDECKTGKARESLSCEKMKEALNNRPLCIKREPVRGKAGERGRTLCREHLVSYTEDFIPRALETHWNILNEVVKSLNLLKQHIFVISQPPPERKPGSNSSDQGLVVGQSLSCVQPFVTPGLQHARLTCPSPSQTHVHWADVAMQSSNPLSHPSPPALNLSQSGCWPGCDRVWNEETSKFIPTQNWVSYSFKAEVTNS